MESQSMEKRFSVHQEKTEDHFRVSIFDDEFHWDACLRIYGDFASMEDKLRYARAICKALNKARIPAK